MFPHTIEYSFPAEFNDSTERCFMTTSLFINQFISYFWTSSFLIFPITITVYYLLFNSKY